MRPPSPSASTAGGTSSLAERQRELLPFTVIGVVCIIAGGLVAAATAPAPTESGTWAAAYLVLVGGVAQAALGLGQVMFTARTSTPVVPVQAAGGNLATPRCLSEHCSAP